MERKTQVELIKRRRIRSLYPLGLKLIKFDRDGELKGYKDIVISYILHDGKRYVLDLVVMMMLRCKVKVGIPITQWYEKLQIWNIHKRLFLFGDAGRDANEYEGMYECMTPREKLDFERGEFNKFTQLPMSWIPWDDELRDTTVRDDVVWTQLESHMVELSLLSGASTTSIPPPTTSTSTTTPPPRRHGNAGPLPLRLQRRPAAAGLLATARRRTRRPLW